MVPVHVADHRNKLRLLVLGEELCADDFRAIRFAIGVRVGAFMDVIIRAKVVMIVTLLIRPFLPIEGVAGTTVTPIQCVEVVRHRGQDVREEFTHIQVQLVSFLIGRRFEVTPKFSEAVDLSRQMR